jgi:hypothetical protein
MKSYYWHRKRGSVTSDSNGLAGLNSIMKSGGIFVGLNVGGITHGILLQPPSIRLGSLRIRPAQLN